MGAGEGGVLSMSVTYRLGCVQSSVMKCYKGVGGVKFSGKKRYLTLEWPLICYFSVP